MKIYLVGGAVRDQLLGLPVKERDYVVVGATPEQMLEEGFRLVGKDFPVFLHPKTHEEYALARTERKTGYGYKGFSCYAAPDVTLEADLQRRDLTINAMAQTSEGRIIDPYQGQSDIRARLLRHVSSAFSEDPVRILRIARFMARFAPLGFRISPDTMALMKKMVQAGEVNALVPERVWQEFSSALTELAPQAFIETLYECGALAVLFPLLQDLVLNQKLDEAPDTPLSCLVTLERATQLTDDPIVRFAAVFCELGKDLPFDSQQVNEKGILAVQALCQYYHVPRAYSSLSLLTVRYLLCCHHVFELDANALLNLLERTGAFRFLPRFHQFLLVCEADFLAHAKGKTNRYLQKERMLSALMVANAVPVAPLKKQGMSGVALGRKLNEQRIQALSRFIGSD